jgi:hypothetical protein
VSYFRHSPVYISVQCSEPQIFYSLKGLLFPVFEGFGGDEPVNASNDESTTAT